MKILLSISMDTLFLKPYPAITLLHLSWSEIEIADQLNFQNKKS
jgi:hypothetical protein